VSGECRYTALVLRAGLKPMQLHWAASGCSLAGANATRRKNVMFGVVVLEYELKTTKQVADIEIKVFGFHLSILTMRLSAENGDE